MLFHSIPYKSHIAGNCKIVHCSLHQVQKVSRCNNTSSRNVQSMEAVLPICALLICSQQCCSPSILAITTASHTWLLRNRTHRVSPPRISDLCGTVAGMVRPKGSMSTEGETLQVSVLPYICSICPPLVMWWMSIP